MKDYPIKPVPFSYAKLKDQFWYPRIETNRVHTIPDIFTKCENSGRIDNFRKASGLKQGPYIGNMPFEDTDVYKVIEGASYSLTMHYDPVLDDYLDGIINLISSAQEKDGYLYTNRTIDPQHVHEFAGPERWSNLFLSHELYNCGHLYEAACAHFEATGKRSLLNIAIKSADFICAEFLPSSRRDVPGHQIIEMGLARLYRITKNPQYLETARFFLLERGRSEKRELYGYDYEPGYCQDHLPVLEQTEAVGHAVRAVYMYCGMADVAALYPDGALGNAIKNIWEDVVRRKSYISGGIGSRHRAESFGEAYELPNLTGYSETCAAIGSVMWNHRLFLLFGETKYLDVLEQILYNGLLSGVSLSGTDYFYVNPLESDGKFLFNYESAARKPWFDVTCCPTNLSRFFPSLSGYVYAVKEKEVYVNLFIAGEACIPVDEGRLHIRQETRYPWNGAVSFYIDPESSIRVRLCIRVPGWARGTVLGGQELYYYEDGPQSETGNGIRLSLNGQAYEINIQDGWIVVEREWNPGDKLELLLPMPVRKVLCNNHVAENRGKAALMRGPLVYCVEQRDADQPLENITLGDPAHMEVRYEKNVLNGIVTLRGDKFTAIPYYAWSNRGANPMKVWLSNEENK